MKERLKNYRTRRIEIAVLVESLYCAYQINVMGSIDAYDLYDDVSEESRNDYRVFSQQMELLRQMTFIDDEECESICKEAYDYRIRELHKIEKVKNNG